MESLLDKTKTISRVINERWKSLKTKVEVKKKEDNKN